MRVVTLVTVDTVVTVVTVVTEKKTSSPKTFFTKKLFSHKKNSQKETQILVTQKPKL